MPSALDHEILDFEGRHSLTNSLVVGTYLKLMAQGDDHLAHAWLDSAVTFEPWTMDLRPQGPYSRIRRPVLGMTLRPMSNRAHKALGGGRFEHGGRTAGIGLGIEHSLGELGVEVADAHGLHLQGKRQ